MNYDLLLILITLVGIVKILIESWKSISEGKYSLDYIAFLAMALSLYSSEYLAGAIVAVMFMGGKSLESFASRKAHQALKQLGDTIPKRCLVQSDAKDGRADQFADQFSEVPIQEVRDGQIILVKRSEIVPLDGVIYSDDDAVLDLANITGESEPAMFKKGTFVRSGSINVGETLTLKVTGSFATSSYQRIVNLVEDAKAHPAGTVRLSEKANLYFTFLTFIIAGASYVLTGDIVRLLAVLVIATPCPLIIAAPVAFVGGMSRAARKGILLRKPAALEGIDAADVMFFDKTGTLTFGRPVLLSTSISDEALSIAASLEIHSLHPYAKTIVEEARNRNIHFPIAEDVREEIGKGISGTVGGKRYSFFGTALIQEDCGEIARFKFGDVMKDGAGNLIADLKRKGVKVAVITGDKQENAERAFSGIDVEIHAGESPEGKHALIEKEKGAGATVIMVGDGLNDAPALARADVGIVFSGTENGASIEAADVAILGSGLEKMNQLFAIAEKTIRVARQSIYGGIGLSVIGMAFAAFGHITPAAGALIQEGIDVVVILNALRTLGGRL